MENVTITFRTKEDIKKQLDDIALGQNRTLSNLIETIILMYLENYEELLDDDNSKGLQSYGEVVWPQKKES